MSDLVERELDNVIAYAKGRNKTLTREHAFVVLSLQYLCYQKTNIDDVWDEIMDTNFTDSKGDGGIDFVYFDEDESEVVVGQNKYSKKITSGQARNEIRKALETLSNFQKASTSMYAATLRQQLQDALDRLTDESDGNIHLMFISLSNLTRSAVTKDLDSRAVSSISVVNAENLEDIILKTQSDQELVPAYTLDLDKAKNFLAYANEKEEGVIVNVQSDSLVRLYNARSTKGLFNLNIRRYIRSKNVDDGIKKTLSKRRDEFWFLNNGLTIACRDYAVDGNRLKLTDFSIVNGAQTTTLIATHKEQDAAPFSVPTKVVMPAPSNDKIDLMSFFNDIAEATNSQKPIQPRDLKANSPEMIQLQRLLEKKHIYLEIKRGIRVPKGYRYHIKNDHLAQLLFSFVNQHPGTARSSKRSLFSVNKNYKAIYWVDYAKDQRKADFLVDLIQLNELFDQIAPNFKQQKADITPEELNIFMNGKPVLFALFGVIYRLVNGDVEISDLLDKKSSFEGEFVYGAFIRHYKSDDIAERFTDLITELLGLLDDAYEIEWNKGTVTSISNFFKTDKKYVDTIVNEFARRYRISSKMDELVEQYGGLLKRE